MLRIVIAIGAYFGLAILANAFAVYFVTQEHYIYYWDWSGYWDRYREISTSLLVHPTSTLHSLIGSVRHDDYNSLPVLILVPFEWLFGSSRLAYILAITNLLLLPAALTMGLFAERVSRLGSLTKAFSPLILVLAILTILTLHPLWIPVLRGLPDIVGIIVIGIILFLHFTKPITEHRLLNLVVTGLLLCILVLLRRWYMFWVVAFFPALALAHGLDIFHRHGLAWRQYVPAARNTVIIGITFTVALFGLAAPLVWRQIHTNYSDIYSAYRSSSGSLLETASHFPAYFGWIVIIGGLSGLAWIAVRRETRLLGSFLIVQFLIVFLLFARTQDFGIQHYYLLIPELSLGIAIVVVRLSELNIKLFWRSTSVACLMMFMLANSSNVMLPRAENLTNVFGRLLPSVRYYPLIRNDINVVGQLLGRLDELELERRGDIYVLASSAILNSDILQNYCRLGPQQRSFCDRILRTADVDKRDGFPRQFLNASYVVVANPTQYSLRPDDQRVIGVLARDVREGNGIGASFQRLPGEFKLDDGVTAWVYTKVRPFERVDVEALADEFAGYYPDKRRIFSTVDE
jgi:hypothetical protein